MQTLQAVITGAIQGLSEFLPISSSAHIVFSNSLYNILVDNSQINKYEEIFFDIAVHAGTLLAVIIYFYNDLKKLVKSFFNSVIKKDYTSKDTKIVLYILLSTLITGIIGLILKKPVENLISSPQYISFFLFITGIILLTSEKMYKGNKEINLKISVLIAIAQGLAIFPGFSRSGLTISTALFNGVKRTEAAKFSFLMSIPIILFAAFLYPFIELDFSQISNFNLKAIIIGALVSFITGYLCIKYFMKFLEKLSLRIFGYYCLIVSCLVFLLFQFFYHH